MEGHEKMKRLLSVFFILFAVMFFVLGGISVHAEVSRIEAVEMISEVLPAYSEGIAFDDTDDKTTAYYRKMGIVRGVEGNLFMPDAPIRAQDFLLMLKRALDVACPDLFYNNQNLRWHYDQNCIAGYAKSQIDFLSSIGIYNESGYIKPNEAISYDDAYNYLNKALLAKETGRRSHNGVMPRRMPPILMYHVIGYATNDNKYLFVTPEAFEEQIKYMYDEGYTFLFPEELSLADSVNKPVVITFDDGYEETYTNAYRVLKKYDAKATLYMVGDYIDKEGYCTSSQLREMSDSSVFRIYSHTNTHTDLTQKSSEQIEAEFSESNDKIYNVTKREVTSVSYPYGFFDDKTLAQAKRYYKNAFSVNRGRTTRYSITRLTADGNFNMRQFKNLLYR